MIFEQQPKEAIAKHVAALAAEAKSLDLVVPNASSPS
jgi:hypothetical protein